jgi:hypothetical protein
VPSGRPFEIDYLDRGARFRAALIDDIALENPGMARRDPAGRLAVDPYFVHGLQAAPQFIGAGHLGRIPSAAQRLDQQHARSQRRASRSTTVCSLAK